MTEVHFHAESVAVTLNMSKNRGKGHDGLTLPEPPGLVGLLAPLLRFQDDFPRCCSPNSGLSTDVNRAGFGLLAPTTVAPKLTLLARPESNKV